MAEKKAYSEAVKTGKYEKPSGLLGKYDNVRRYWEDQVTGIFLRQELNALIESKQRSLERIRILDLGCGSGDGYELLSGITTTDPGLYEYITCAIPRDLLKEYLGLDINPDLLQQANDHYGQEPKVRLVQGDISDGLPLSIKEEEPFDVYFTSYGTLSHFHDEQNSKLISDICDHAKGGGLFVGDWLGRYSYEWQELWDQPVDKEYFMDYRISYIGSGNNEEKTHVSSFPLRLTTRDEIHNITTNLNKEAKGQITPLGFFDRSIPIGRHMDTREYNKNAPKLRAAVNSLFESYVRTDLETLLVDYVPHAGFEHLNNFFEMFFMSWNTLIKYTISLLRAFDRESKEFGPIPEVLPFYPDPLKEALHSMRHVVEGIGWLKWGDVRANVIEPHLAFSLRKLEMELQPGTGVGHGLVGIFGINR